MVGTFDLVLKKSDAVPNEKKREQKALQGGTNTIRQSDAFLSTRVHSYPVPSNRSHSQSAAGIFILFLLSRNLIPTLLIQCGKSAKGERERSNPAQQEAKVRERRETKEDENQNLKSIKYVDPRGEDTR